MRMKRWAILSLAIACQAQQETPDAALVKVRATVAESLGHLPNLTCTETIRRSLWYKSTATPEMVDTVRVEVAYVDRKELYGWPGASRIDEPDLAKLVGGSVANGYFALFLNNIFLVKTTTFHYAGHAKLEGAEMLRYEYRVPKEAGAYRLASARGAALVGYHGSFWVRADTASLARIAVIADKVPTDLGYSAATSTLDFGEATVGARGYLVPMNVEVNFTDTTGNQHRSELNFRAWHEFVGESSVKFNLPARPPSIEVPREFSVDVDLETDLDSATLAAGDPMAAVLRGDIQADGRMVVPKGARVFGRVARFAKNGPAYVLEFNFTALDFEGGHVELAGRENRVTVENWARISKSASIHLARGTHLNWHSQAK